MTSEPARNEPLDEFLARTLGPVDKPGRAGRILDENPDIAGEVARRLSVEPLPEGVVAPITTAMPAGTPPIEYVLHVWTYKCSICQTEHKHSELFGVNHLRSRTGAGNFVKNMSPAARLEWQVPLKVHNITTRVTAGCFECLDAIRDEILPTLPRPPIPQAILKSAPEGAAGPARPDTGPKSPKGRPLTTDDFLV